MVIFQYPIQFSVPPRNIRNVLLNNPRSPVCVRYTDRIAQLRGQSSDFYNHAINSYNPNYNNKYIV